MTCKGKPVIISFRLPCWWDEAEMEAEGLPTDLDLATRGTLCVDPRTGEVRDWSCLDAMTYVGVELAPELETPPRDTRLIFKVTEAGVFPNTPDPEEEDVEAGQR